MKEVGSLTRENIERNLTFAGFIALSCPLKKYSEDCVQQLKDSSHHVSWLWVLNVSVAFLAV